MDKKKKIYMVGNTHIDPVWLWNRAEGMQEVKSSFASALDRMDEFPMFKFTHSSISYLEWLQENCPEMFERIKERVKEGRWEIAGGMWTEPDSDIPSGESVIRHFLYGKKFVKAHFGKEVKTSYNVDSFGHGSNLPAVYAGCGISRYLISRPGRKSCKVPPVFMWKAKNGSQVMTEMTGGEYMAWTKQAIEVNLSESLETMEEYGQDTMAVFYGVGNHGGGPTVDNIHSVLEMIQEHPELEMEFATISDFFSKVDPAKLPIVEGELGRIFYGCYSSDNEIKRLNRKAEWTLVKAEAICTMAAGFAGQSYAYPYEKLEEAWKELLFNQFHDVLAGTSIEPARNEAVEEMTSSIAIARKLIHNGVQAIANSIDTRGEGFPIVFVNPCGVDFEGLLFADVYVPRAEKKPLRIRDTEGKECEFVETNYHFYTKESRKGILLKAKIPAYGYGVYRVMFEGSEKTVFESDIKVQNRKISNGIIEITMDEKTGCPCSVKKSGHELLAAPISVKVFYDDRGAWGAPSFEEKLEGSFQCSDIEVIEENFLRTIIRSCLTYGQSELVLDFIVEQNTSSVKVNGWIHNHERHSQISLSVPLAGEDISCATETGFLVEQRVVGDGTEYYQHRFANLSDREQRGIAVLNTSAYGMRMKGNEYLAILSRSAMFARGNEGPEERTMKNRFMDQGVWEFSLELLAHEKQVSNQQLFQMADFLHMPVEYLGDSNHLGTHFLRSDSMVEIKGKGIASGVFKRMEEDHQGYIVRIFETLGKETKATIKIRTRSEQAGKSDPGAEWKLKPYEIKTLAYTAGKWSEVNCIEE